MCAARWRALQPFAFAATSICAPLSSVLGGMGRRGSRGRERECAGGSRCQEGTGRVSGGSSRRAVRNLSMSYSAALLTASINSLFLFCWSPSSNLCARSSEDLAMCVTVWGSTKSTNRQEVRTQRYYGLTKDPGRLRLSQERHSSLTRVRAALSPVVGQSDFARLGRLTTASGPPNWCVPRASDVCSQSAG